MSTVIANIKSEIIKKITALTSVNKVYSYEKLNPAGYPCVFVTFSSNDNEFFTNAENKRVYGYRILVLCQIGQDRTNSDKVDKAEQQIEQITGDILDSLDSDITLGDNSQVIYVEASIGEPGYIETEAGWARSVTISTKVHSIYVV